MISIRENYKKALAIEPNIYAESYIRALICKNIIPKDEDLRDNIIAVSIMLKKHKFTYEDIKKAINYYKTKELEKEVVDGFFWYIKINTGLSGYQKVKAERQAKAVLVYCFFREALKNNLWGKSIEFTPHIKIDINKEGKYRVEISFNISKIEDSKKDKKSKDKVMVKSNTYDLGTKIYVN